MKPIKLNGFTNLNLKNVQELTLRLKAKGLKYTVTKLDNKRYSVTWS